VTKTNETRTATGKPDPTHMILTLTGILGLVLFILACRPSWSPDSQKVLYSYWDDASKKAAVAVFDRKTRTSHIIFEWWDELGSSSRISAAQWTKDGERAIVTIYEEKGVQLLSLPMSIPGAAQAYTLKKMDETFMLPYPEANKNLFLAGGEMIIKVNLENGAIFRKEAEDDLNVLLYDAGNQVLYLRRIEKQAPKPETTKSSEGKSEKPAAQTKEPDKPLETVEAYEFGELDQKDLSLHPRAIVKAEELKAKGIGDLSGLADANATGSKLATTDEKEGNRWGVVVIGADGVEQSLKADANDKPHKLGNPQWSRDEKTIYVTALIDDPGTKKSEFAVLEVATDGRNVRKDRIEERASEDFDSDYLPNAQIALSPDGKCIAVTNGHLEKVRPERRGLFLLDLSKPERPVKFYPAPALPVAK